MREERSRNRFNNTQEHDKTKSMLDKIRGVKRANKGLLDEDAAEEIEPGMAPVDDEEEEPQMAPVDSEEYVGTEDEGEAVEPEADMVKKEQDNLEQYVNGRLEIDTFKIYPENKNAIMGGKIPELGNLTWQYTLDEFNGVYVSIDNLKLTDEAFEAIKSLKNYYKSWEETWATKVKSEYKSNEEEDES